MDTIKDKRILIRVDYNVPISNSGEILDNSRIKASISTIKKIIKKKPKQIIIITHIGRPKRKEKELRTDEVAKELEKLLNSKVKKVDHCGEGLIPKDKIIFLENLRFYEGEKKGSKNFARQLAKLGDVYINESFGTTHRKDASMYATPKLFNKNKIILGENTKLEINKLSEVLNSKDLDVIVGFAKISDKIEILEKLMKRANRVFIGGKVIFAFMKAQGLEIGKVDIKEEDVKIAKKIIKKYSKKIIMPVDFAGEKNGHVEICESDEIEPEFVGYDIGPKSVIYWEKLLSKSKLIFWNGPLGYFEKMPFDESTNKIAKYISKKKIKAIIGGGDTVSAIKKSGYDKKMYHISTGGGASLKFIEKNGKLPVLNLFGKVIKNR